MQLLLCEEVAVLLQDELPPAYGLRFLSKMFEDEVLVGVLEDEERTHIDKTGYQSL